MGAMPGAETLFPVTAAMERENCGMVRQVPAVTRGQKWLLAAAIAVGACWAILCHTGSYLWYILMLELALGIFTVLNREKVYRQPAARHLGACCAAIGIGLLVVDATPVAVAPGAYEGLYDTLFLGTLAMPCLMMVYAVFTVYEVPKKREAALIGRFFAGFLKFPFLSVPRFFAAIGAVLRGKGRSGRGTRLAALAGILAAVPLTGIVLALLARADAGFASALTRVFRFDGDRMDAVAEAAWMVANGFVCAMLFYSFFYTGRYRDCALRPAVHREWPAVGFCVVEAALACAYAAFLLLQFTYLFGGTLPEAYTYSEYAVRGFRELMAVTVINDTVLALSVTLGSRSTVRRVLEWLVLGAQVLLLPSAGLRLGLYIHASGWTERRMLSCWLETLLGGLAVLTGVRLAREDFPMARTALIGGAALSALLFVGAVPFLRAVMG